VRRTSPGPALFTQTRVGLHGKPFKIYKFRSMRQDAEARLKELVDIEKLPVPGFKLKNDPRVTPIGRLLRRTSLDEIPQLINVLKGEMSLVGPRPEMPQLVERYNSWQRRRLKAKPGMTGWQQVMARGVPLAAAIEYDLVYLKHQSLLLDLYIMVKTVQVVIFGSGVTH
jgi:lipopolysaccharide/colanic/teichoic acid biosynthesis glycosyltransferase